MYINAINKKTESVGFAISGPVVIGYYCPAPLDYEAASLMKNVPKVRKAPEAPKVPEGVPLGDNTDFECPIITPANEADGTLAVREACSLDNCCGKTKQGETVVHEATCRPSAKTEWEDDGKKYTFTCYEDARRLVLSLSAIAVSVAFYI
jgi:hypothetical protein